jgi:hypothetical protein
MASVSDCKENVYWNAIYIKPWINYNIKFPEKLDGELRGSRIGY